MAPPGNQAVTENTNFGLSGGEDPAYSPSHNSWSFDGPLLTQSQWSGAVNGTVSREFDAKFCARIVSGPAFCAGAYVSNGNGLEHTEFLL